MMMMFKMLKIIKTVFSLILCMAVMITIMILSNTIVLMLAGTTITMMKVMI